MQLSLDNINLFYKLHPSLLFYVNEKLGILADRVQTPDELKQLGVDKVAKVRDKLLGNIELIDDFIKDNPFGFSQKELDIVSSWRYYVKGRFFVLKYLKNYAIFLDDKKPARVYGVKALVSFFEDMIGDYLPIMVDAVLLPFKQWIIYDGFLFPHNMFFGGGIRADLNEEFKIAKAQFGIIESLPIINQAEHENDGEKLKRYLKTETSRQHFSKEIFELVKKSHELKVIYHQERGKIYARLYKKDLSDVGILGGWFGILQGVLVASGSTKEELDKIIEKIVPPKKQDLIFQFQMKEGK